jgi:glutamyl-Q tRNA(Asp) synthetase
VGSLATALASYADAKHVGGDWRLRIEDVDEHRSVKGSKETIINTLAAYGFEWDGPIEVQSSRKKLYRAALDRLEAHERVFVCKCSRKLLSKESINISGEPLYPGTCRDEQHEDFGHVALRFITEDKPLKWTDLHFGPQIQNLAKDVGDFVLRRTDGLNTYQLAVVVDDHDQGVTRVVRGADLMSSTARQIALQEALGLSTPQYLHLPILVDGRGDKLSKSSFAAAVSAADPVATLSKIWGVLGQTAPSVAYTHPRDFLTFAAAHWNAAHLPKTMTIPYPML